MIEFLTPGQRIKKLRKKLNIKQYDLQGERVKRNFISMIENGERGLSKETAKFLANRFNNKAKELGIDLLVDDKYLLMTKEDEARQYCLDKLNQSINLTDLEQIIEISIKYDMIDIEAYAFLVKGNLYFNDKDYSKALIFYVESLSKYSFINDKIQESFLFNKLGLCKLNELYYYEALEFFNKAYTLSIINNDFQTRKNSCYNIALCHRKLYEFNKSIKFIDEFLSLCDKNSEFTNYLYANVIKANCYRDLKEYDNAFNIYNFLLNCFKECCNLNNELITYVYDNVGLLYADNMEYEKALMYLDLSQKIRTEIDIENLAKSLIDKSNILIKQKRFNEALILINLGIDIAKKYSDYEYELKGYYLSIEVYEELNLYKELEKIYLKILEIIKEKKDYKAILNISNDLCLLYLNNNKFDKAKELIKSLQQNEKETLY